MQLIYTLISALAGYKFCSVFTHPSSKIWQSCFPIKTKRVQVFPSLRIFVKGRVIHFHHWLNLSILLCISIFISGGILDSWITRGALVGGIIQGLTTSSPTARKIIYRKKIDVQL